MAGSSLYKDGDDAEGITDINVTPFVDVVLVLLVVFIVTAKLIVARGIEVEPPKAASGGEMPSKLKIVVKENGDLFINDKPFTDDAAAIAVVKAAKPTLNQPPKVIISGDRRTAFAGVMRAIDIANQAGVGILLENTAKE